MEFEFNVNQLFLETISLVGRDTLLNAHSLQRAQLQKNLEVVIDEVGKKSAKAQHLTGAITNLQKSLFHGHHVYVLKDSQTNNRLGSVVGYIKVGKKRLFLLDHYGNHNELYPLCVLDFYVHESQQRKGCGLRLFKHMLSSEGVKVNHLAIDRPSHKFLSFLKKHFNISAKIPQVNNFVIFEGFFNHRTDVIRSSTANSKYDSTPFRPLSRAVSDGIIKRSRQSDNIVNTLKDLRPVSGRQFDFNQGHDPFSNRNNRRRKWHPDGSWQSISNHSAPVRSNPYSRYAHELQRTGNGLPPLPPSRMGPHSQRHNSLLSTFEKRTEHQVGDQLREISDEGKHATPDAEKSHSEAVLHQVKDLSIEDRSETEKCNNLVNTVEKPPNAYNTVKPATYVSRYKNPSDMITELKEKDETNRTASAYHHGRRLTNQRNGTSWNVFGIPPKFYWAKN